MKAKNKDKNYWMCIIGGVPDDVLPWGADSILRQPVRDVFNKYFGNDEVCSSGWGVNEERYKLLQIITNVETKELKKAVEFLGYNIN